MDQEEEKGFWCADCDMFTYFDQEKRIYDFILEKNNGKNHISIPDIKLKKHISPLRYPGGKTKMITTVYNLLSKDKKIFIEPYAGGASIGLSLLFAGIIDKLMLNDIDIGVYTLFKYILYKPQDLIYRIKTVQPSRTLFFQYREMIKKGYIGYSELDIAFGFLLVNRCAYSGIYNANPLSNITSRWNVKTLEYRILNIHSYKEKIVLTNIDALEIIENEYYNENNIIFIDPPYYQKGKLLYPSFYQKEEHIKLASLIHSLTASMPKISDIIVTYDLHQDILDLYRDTLADIKYINRRYSI